MKSATRASEINKPLEIDFSENIHRLKSAGEAPHQVGDSDSETAGEGAGTLMDRLSETPKREIEGLVGRLMKLHKKLQTDGERIQHEIERYTELNRCVLQLTTIVADSVGKLPAPRIN
jgi:hypothetical protein